ncbi:FAD/NAD(P)-binding protein [Streptomyces sp. NPDC029216]|uniref:FAD/NAD(P)-binding protein n=1 Tax=Streptomyces sp. NPDC029216 TaxID=3154701 RepID=UPI0033E915C4
MVAPGTAAVRIALVGAGPRALSVLERICALCAEHGVRADVEVVDPGTPGTGLHRPQPDHLLLNTIAAQVTGFADPAMLGRPDAGPGGPTLFSWARERGLGRTGSGWSYGGRGRPVRPADYLPRRVLGEYLAWCWREIADRAGPGVRITHHRAEVTDVVRTGGGERLLLSDGRSVEADSVVLALGHGLPGDARPEPADRRIRVPYPLPDAVAPVPDGARVAVLGTGLAAMDVIAALTVGRGGRLTGGPDGRPRYLPSGREPRITWVSRSGLPYRSRPEFHPDRVAPPARHFTPAAVRALRTAAGDGRIDFERELLPLLRAELDDRLGPGSAHTGAGLLAERVPEEALTDAVQYAKWFLHSVQEDLEQALIGVEDSPLKAALEVLRDHRETIRLAVDAPGLTPESTRWFFTRFTGELNRLVTGPHAERTAEVLAIAEAGVLTPGPGPAPALVQRDLGWDVVSTGLAEEASVRVDWLVGAHLPALAGAELPAAEEGGRERDLLGRLLGRGRLRRLTAAGAPLGIEVDAALRVRDAAGLVSPTLSAFGPLTEGSTFYNHYVPSPGSPSRALREADLLAARLLRLDQTRAQAPEQDQEAAS